MKIFKLQILGAILFLTLCNCQSTHGEEKGDDVAVQKQSVASQGEKIMDPKSQLYDIFAVTEIYGEPIRDEEIVEGVERPTVEMNTKDMKVMGTDGCNQYHGMIESVEGEKIVFGGLASTRMMCRDMTIPGGFMKAMSEVASFKRDDQLHFYDKDGKEVLRLRKVD